MGFLDNIGKTISDAGQGALQKGKDIADVAKYNSMISEEEKKITNIYEQIGRQYVDEYGENPAESFQGYIAALKTAKENIEEYQQKLQDLKGVTQCPNCGAQVPNGSLFCAACGTKMEIPVPEGVYCVGCGAFVPSGNKFCTSCGRPVENVQSVTVDQGGEQ